MASTRSSAADVDLSKLAVEVEGLDLEENRLGAGAYGIVYRVTVPTKDGGRLCVAKKLHEVLAHADSNFNNTTSRQRDFIVEKFKSECRILSTLDHPNVVGFVGVHFGRDQNDISLVMELLHTNLDTFVEQYPNTPPHQRISILCDVSEGLYYLHSLTPPLIHRDLTAFNILLTEDYKAKIADLGVSRFFDPSMANKVKLTQNPGHQVYMPPESQLQNPAYTTKLDIFSFGNLIIHTINGELPDIFKLPLERVNELSSEGREELMRRGDSFHEKKMSERHSLYPLVVCCLHDRPEERPEVETVRSSLKQLYEKYPKEVSVCAYVRACTFVCI